jgi:hypothetical protein
MIAARPLLLAAACASLALSERAEAQSTADVAFATRVRALALDERCALFSDDVRLALDAGAAQSRNALLRAGWSDAVVLRAALIAATDADALACQGVEAAGVSSEVTGAYQAWRQLRAMAFPGNHRTWNARRLDAGEGWLMVQNVASVRGGPILFGVARREDGEVRLALALPRDERPRAARALIRDRAIAPTRVENELARLAGRSDADPLGAAAAPDVFTRQIWAAERASVDADSEYAEGLDGAAALFWFPASSIEALADLDPREAIAIEVDLAARRGGERTDRLYVEIGDFAPAAMFVYALGQVFSAESPPAPPNPASLIR